jgi:DMSO/TMAO reductase YedYZ molybdopterin-dependent catalytic subunit
MIATSTAIQPQVENTEYDFASLNSFITPTEQFYIRNHYPYPAVDKESWQVHVTGEVARPFALTFAELSRFEAKTLTVTLECAGNHRSFLDPKVDGLQWGQGAVSNAEWTGVPLSALLERAGVKADAVEVIIEGADKGEVKATPKPKGEIHFARSLPLDHPVLADALLAFQMNGEPLSLAHGYPLRLVVPGWYAMASVKWVQRLIVTKQPFHGYYQSVDYAVWDRMNGAPSRVPITTMLPKAAIARPTTDEVLSVRSPFRIHGAAWSGDAEITKVEVSTDGGKQWCLAQLLGESMPYAWRLWTFVSEGFAKPGSYQLMARATDSKGRTQPMQRGDDLENYLISHVIPVPVTAR